MPLLAVFLDTGPLSTATQKPGHPDGEACRLWINTLSSASISVLVPEITDYELRRELLRSQNANAIQRLDAFNANRPNRYVPLTTSAMQEAARLWATVRNLGQPTASNDALDGDVILAAQVRDWCAYWNLPLSDVVVATVNVRHISRLVPSATWQQITPGMALPTLPTI